MSIKLYVCPDESCRTEGDLPGRCPACGTVVQVRAHLVWLPQVFWFDHMERALPAGDAVRRRGHLVQILCSEAELAEIQNDAEHYAHPSGPDGEGLGGLIASAKATVRRIVAYRAAADRCAS